MSRAPDQTEEREDGRPEPGARGRDSVWSRLAVLLLMILVLVAAGLLSAMTAMRFAIRGREVDVPDLTGVEQSEAAETLARVGLAFEPASRRFSATVPDGHIIDQTPPAGTSVKRDRAVRVLVSLGERRFAVPDVEGSSLRSTQVILSQRGLSIGSALYSHTEEGERSSVVYQSPAAGDTGGVNPEVDVLVSLGSIGDYFVMPDLIGERAQDVVGRIRREGFRLGETTTRPQPGVERGRIVRQQPAAGYRVSRNDVILLEVSQ
jgi:serine/threonine-protein kinase